MKSLSGLLVVWALGGCAGQLDLPPEAYGAGNLTAPGGSGGTTGLVTGMGSWTGMADAGAPAVPDAWPPAVTDALAAPEAAVAPPTVAPPAGPAASAPATPVDAQPAADAATPIASACPPGVEPLALITQRCGNCHGAKTPAKNLDLVSPGVADRLINTKSACQDRPQLDVTSNPLVPRGHFLDKMKGPVDGCGAQMPYGTPALTAPELDCLIDWSARAIARTQKGQ